MRLLILTALGLLFLCCACTERVSLNQTSFISTVKTIEEASEMVNEDTKALIRQIDDLLANESKAQYRVVWPYIAPTTSSISSID